MKKVSFILFFLFACFISYQASGQDTLQVSSQQLVQTILDRIDHEVVLSEQQEQEVYALLLKRAEQINKMKSTGKATKLTKESLTSLNGQAYTKLKRVLTKEQYQKFHALREHTREQKEKYSAEQLYRSEQDIVLDF